jgi:pimeloyl-ACP methyl ester carboxylesterase
MKVIVKGLATEYQDEGSGPILLMLHGWGDSLHSFDLLAHRLGGFRVVRLDLPGFGGTELPHGDWDVADYARFVAEFCEKISIKTDYLLGHSFGGRINIKSLAHGILSAQKLILVGSAGVADRPTLQNNAFMTIAKVGKVLLKPFPRSWYLNLRRELYNVTGGDYVSAGALKETFVRVISEDLSTDAAHLKLPTLLVWGEDDLVTPISEGRKLNELIEDSKLHILHGAGHFVHQQKTDEVAELIKKFLV